MKERKETYMNFPELTLSHSITVGFNDHADPSLEYIEISYDEGGGYYSSSGSVSLYDKELDRFLEVITEFKSKEISNFRSQNDN